MTGRGPEREILVSLGCVVFCVLLLLFSFGQGWTHQAMDWTAWLLRLPEMPMVALERRFSATRRWFRERDSMVAALAALQEENRQLWLQLGQISAQKFAAQANRQNLFLVDFRDPMAWWDEIRVSLAGQTEPKPGTAALDGANLVGVVSSAGSGSAWIRLISSSALYIPVVIETDRDVGVVVGDGDGSLWLKYMPLESSYQAGTRLETALGSESLPPGIPVGTLTGERRQPVPGMIEYRVQPGARLFRLQAVSLLRREEGP